MKGKLRDISITSPIGLLPNTINTNNRILAAEFDNLFDASNNVLIKSVDASAGMVRAHWGYFVNIEADRITIKDTSASFGNILKNVNHNSLGKRYFDDFLPEERLMDDYYAHDINMIKGLPKALAILNASVETLWKSLSVKKPNGGQYNDALTGTVLDASLKYSGPAWSVDPENPEYIYPVDDASLLSASHPEDNVSLRAARLGLDESTVKDIETSGSYKFAKQVDAEYVNVFHSDSIKYSYPLKYYGASEKFLKNKVKINGDYHDIMNNMQYNYYQVVSAHVKVDNEKPISLSMSNVGAIVNLLLDAKDKAKDFKIKLNNHPYEHVIVKAKDARTTRIKLICVGLTDDYGPQFDVYEYSGTISIE